MRRALPALLIAAALAIAAAPPPAPRPVSALRGELGDLLRAWHKDGSAAGNTGDVFDNRDRDHSPLDLAPFPQLRKHVYSADEISKRADWALRIQPLPGVVFGNSSTSAPAHLGGSNPRTAYVVPQLLAMLEKQYLGNNLFIYPEHRDYDPGHNGFSDGYGDLYPTNTPYVIISQGSSGSDQPFMRAIPSTLAAFRPEVKKKLVETNLLMPTVQMIFRSSNKNASKPEDYFTAKAHPPVFDGGNVDPLAMAKKAHSLGVDSLPALAKIRVVREDAAVNGRDYFEPPVLTEKHADLECVAARIYRGVAMRRTYTLSAADSVDVNKRPLSYRWVLLRGDPARVAVTPKGKGETAEVVIDFHERRPIAPGSPLASNRVEVAVFADNGVHPSAPAFFTLVSLDSERRTYSPTGKIREAAYAATTAHFIADKAVAGVEAAASELDMWNKRRDEFVKARAKLPEAARKALDDRAAKLETLGVGTFDKESRAFTPTFAFADGPTAFEREALREFHLFALAALVHPVGLKVEARTNYVDHRLATVKAWRDVYPEADDNVGWTRRFYDGRKPQSFTPEGWLVTEKDAMGRPTKARSVRYVVAEKRQGVHAVLEMREGDEVMTIGYEGGKRKVAGREKAS